MLLGTNLKIRPLEKEDFDLFYEWMQTQDCLGNFMDMQMIYKERFLETLENSLKKPERFYAIIENNDGKPIGEINSIQILGSNTTVEIGMFIAETSFKRKRIWNRKP
jgi:RimJ/RimL family protein N-acetyltransferase